MVKKSKLKLASGKENFRAVCPNLGKLKFKFFSSPGVYLCVEIPMLQFTTKHAGFHFG